MSCPFESGQTFFLDPMCKSILRLTPIDALERRKGPEFAKPISIGDDCWIGGGVIISPGITVGNRCIVGAGAVVTKDIPSDTIVVGNPAKPVVKLGA